MMEYNKSHMLFWQKRHVTKFKVILALKWVTHSRTNSSL